MVQVVLILKNRWRISVWFLALLSGGEMCAVIYFRALGAIDITFRVVAKSFLCQQQFLTPPPCGA